MPETTDSPGAGQRDAFPDTGALLRRAREEKGLTIPQVAQSLHLDAWILEALEANRFKDIGAPVFVKGHLRKFADEVGASQEAVMEAYFRAEDTPETPMLVTDTLTRPAGDSRGRGPVIALSVVLLALIALVAWLWLRGQEFVMPWSDRAGDTMPAVSGELVVSEPGPLAASGAEEILSTVDVLGDSKPADPATEDATEPPAGSVADSDAGAPVTREDAAPDAIEEALTTAIPDGMISLSIAFANDSWVEIYDSDNRRLYFDLGKAGTRRTVIGSPPLQVLLGNADGAELSRNNAAFEIPAGARRGKTARFTVQ